MRQLELLHADVPPASLPVVILVLRDAYKKFGRPQTDGERRTVGAWCRAEVERRLKAEGAAADRPAAVRVAYGELASAVAESGGVPDEPAF
jgi:hypothetical protein